MKVPKHVWVVLRSMKADWILEGDDTRVTGVYLSKANAVRHQQGLKNKVSPQAEYISCLRMPVKDYKQKAKSDVWAKMVRYKKAIDAMIKELEADK